MSLKASIAVFDVGNILLRWDPRNLYVKIFDDPDEMAFFLEEVCTGPWNLEQDRGRSWEEAIAEASARHPDYAPAIQAYRARWTEMLGPPIAENVALLETLRAKGVPCYAITNFAADTFALSQARFPFLNGFDGVICSGLEGVVKPDPAIFRLLLERYGLKAEDCLFIDDSAHNVAGAARLGFNTIHHGLGLDAAGAFRQFGFPV